MSETVLLIGVAHAIPVLIVGLVSRSETVMTITAAIMALIGMATGSPSYMAVDIGGVVLGIFLFYAFGMPREKTLHISTQNEKQSNFDMEQFLTLNNYRN
jgi:flagellar biosynthesis component FlhA